MLAVGAFVVALAPSTSAILEDNPRRMSEYAKGDKPCVAVDGANLREKPAADAKVVASLPLGDVVEVIDRASAAETVGDRVDRFYEVSTSSARGFVFGNVLTNACASADVDGDGVIDRVTLAWTSTYLARVRIAEKGGVVSVDVRVPASTKSAHGGEARFFEVPPLPGKKNAPVGVVVCRAEACVASLVVAEAGMAGVLLTSDVAANADPAKSVRVDAAKSSVALGADRAQLGGWPLVTCPHCAAPPTAWTSIAGAPLEPRALFAWPSDDPTFRDDRSFDGGCTSIGVVDDGPYAGKAVVKCAEPSTAGKGPSTDPPSIVFIEDAARRFVRVKDGGASPFVDAKLQAARVTFATTGAVALRGVGASRLVLERNGGRLEGATHLTGDNSGFAAAKKAPVLFVHRDLGRVRGDLAYADGFALDDGHGFEGLEIDARAPAGKAVQLDRGCGLPEVLLAKAGARAGPLAGSALDEVVAFHATKLDGFGGLTSTLDAKQVRSWLAEAPPEAVVDPFDRLLVAVKPDARLKRPCAIEPMLYLDDDDAVDATVTFGSALSVSGAWPPLSDGAWRVHVDGASAPLFWEGVSARTWPATTAAVVRGVDAEPVLDALARDAGLPDRARVEFVRAWSKLMAPLGLVRVGVVDRGELDRLAPVEISPAPSTFTRLYVVVERVEDGSPASERVSDVAARGLRQQAGGAAGGGGPQGLRAAEWGGVIVESR